jgi:membrane protein involved in colicin uptake
MSSIADVEARIKAAKIHRAKLEAEAEAEEARLLAALEEARLQEVAAEKARKEAEEKRRREEDERRKREAKDKIKVMTVGTGSKNAKAGGSKDVAGNDDDDEEGDSDYDGGSLGSGKCFPCFNMSQVCSWAR